MDRQGRIVALALACLPALTGCDLDRFGSPQDRINHALPVDESAQSLISTARESTAVPPDARSRFEQQLAGKLQQRALSCAAGYQPKWWESEERIRSRLHNTACFEEQDRLIGRWVTLLRVGWLIAEPPLRSIPAEAPREMTAAGPITGRIQFAKAAGIATLETATGLSVRNLGSSEVLTQASCGTEPSGPLSDNGRVFVYSGAGGAELRDSVSGKTLLVLPGVHPFQFIWLDARRAIYTVAEPRRQLMVDFQSGTESPIEAIRATIDGAFATTEAHNEYFVMTGGGVTKVEATAEGSHTQVRILDERPCPACGWSLNGGGLIPDGHTYAEMQQGKLLLVSLTPIQLDWIDLAPLNGLLLTPTPDPDKLLLEGLVRGEPGYKRMIYSRRDRTLATVEDPANTSKRFQYAAGLRKLALIEANRVSFIDLPSAGIPEPMDDYLKRFRERANDRALAAFDSARTAPSTSPSQPMLPGLSKGTRIDAVGVYEGARAGHAAGAQGGQSVGGRGGAVTVIVRKSSRPIVLVLSSYEGVAWTVMPMPGAQLRAILTSSHSEATVSGQGAIPVYSIGTAHAYSDKTADFRALLQEVIHWTGAAFGTFQGRYSATTYTVGGDD